MIYGYRAESVIVDCYNEGDVSTGMRIRFTALGTVSNPILLNVDTEEFIQIKISLSFRGWAVCCLPSIFLHILINNH